MMTALLLNGYASGIYSSRRIAKASIERADFMMIVAGDPPDFRTISDFRKRHLKVLAGLFVQVLKLAGKAGLVRLGHVALDGTKIKANASKRKAMSHARMKQRAAELQAEVDRWLAAAEAADAEEDKRHGARRGDEMPKWVADEKKRIEGIREAKVALEAEAKAAAEEQRRVKAEAEEKRIAEGRKKRSGGKPDKPITEDPDPKAQRNFTDPESRIMTTWNGVIQGYNAQAAVDGEAQIIVACGLIQTTSDHGQVVPLVDGIEANLGRKPTQVSADCGYLSEANLGALQDRQIDGYIATGRASRPTDHRRPGQGPLTQAMRKKIADGGFETPYRLRKQIVEAVFGQIKQARGFRQFLLRGVEQVCAEWAMVCAAHNLTKLAKAARAAYPDSHTRSPTHLDRLLVRDLLPGTVVDLVDRDDGLRAAVDTELLQDGRDVRLDGRLGNAELIGNLLVQQAFPQHHQHPHLLRCQRRQPRQEISRLDIDGGGKIDAGRRPDIAVEHAADGRANLVDRLRLRHKAGGATVHAAADGIGIVIGRNDHHGDFRMLPAQKHETRNALYPGHSEIEQNQVDIEPAGQLVRQLVERSGFYDFGGLERRGKSLIESAAEQRMIVHNDDAV